MGEIGELITVYTFLYPHHSYVYKSKLESENIFVYLKDELTVQNYHFISNTIGGVKLQVFEKDVDKALELLAQAGLKVGVEETRTDRLVNSWNDKLIALKNKISKKVIVLLFVAALLIIWLMN